MILSRKVWMFLFLDDSQIWKNLNSQTRTSQSLNWDNTHEIKHDEEERIKVRGLNMMKKR